MRAVVLAVLVLLTGVAEAAAQAPARLAVLSPIASSEEAIRRWVLPELARAGFTEGRNLVVDFRVGSLEAFPALARAIVAEKPGAIISVSGGPLSALRAATTTIPIVSAGGDPVGLGFAASMSRPGGNVTGFVISGADLDAKRMELLGQILGPGFRSRACCSAITRQPPSANRSCATPPGRAALLRCS